VSAGDQPYASWWHDGTEAPAFRMAYDMASVRRETTVRHDVEVFEHPRFGRAIAVDGVLQSVEQDAAHREMLVHVPVLGRARRPCRALVVGEDATVVTELLKHDFVATVGVSVDDPALFEISAEAFGVARVMRDPRVAVRSPAVGESLADFGEALFDVVFAAAADLRRPAPAGSTRATTLHDALATRLAPDGVVADCDLALLARTGPWWYRDPPGAGRSLLAAVRHGGALPSMERYFTTSPLALGGFLGFFLYSKGAASCAEPRSGFDGAHYNADLHRAAFALPTFWNDLP
jgi:spermidine synthase